MLSSKQKAELAKKGLVTTGAAAKMLGVSCQWLWKQIDKGLLPAEKFEGPGPAGYSFVYGVDFKQAEECRDLYFRNPPPLPSVSRETIPQEIAEQPAKSAKAEILEKLGKRKTETEEALTEINNKINILVSMKGKIINSLAGIDAALSAIRNLED